MYKLLFKYCVPLLFLVGCTAKIPPLKEENITSLATLLYSLDTTGEYREAKQLSKDIFLQTEQLAHAFKLTSPPQYHNFLVTIGLREKGLCYHWSDALYSYLSRQKYNTFIFHLVGANIGNYWTEHNAVVVTVKGMNIDEGILLDPWRNSGKLYFSRVKDDKKYHWIDRPDRELK